jgi:hypothetical protein
MVVVTIVVDVPDPRVYVRTTLSEPLGPPVPWAPLPAETPVPRGIDGTVTTPAAVLEAVLAADAVAEYDSRAFELADSASSTGQTVYKLLGSFHASDDLLLAVVIAMTSVITVSLVDAEARQSVTVAAQLVIV